MPGQIPDWIDEVGEGWREILEELHKDLSYLDPNYSIAQVKEKFGGLRVYLDSVGSNWMWRAIAAAENLSCTTCEVCGEPGKTRTPKGRPGGWVHTVCEDHWA